MKGRYRTVGMVSTVGTSVSDPDPFYPDPGVFLKMSSYFFKLS